MGMDYMRRIAICEDNLVHIREFQLCIKEFEKEYNQNFQITIFQNGHDLLDFYRRDNNPFDLLFLDIYLDLDSTNGMEIAKKIREKNSEVMIIFLTGAVEYVFDGYKVNSFRYMVKPLKYSLFKEDLYEAVKLLKWDVDEEEFILVKENSNVIKLSLSKILYMESLGRKVRIVTNTKEIVTYGKLIQFAEELSDKHFFQVHRAFLVNMQFIREIYKSGVILINSDFVPCSQRSIPKLKNSYLEYMTINRGTQ
jgi:two-component system, LytTR family, response regulator LytT